MDLVRQASGGNSSCGNLLSVSSGAVKEMPAHAKIKADKILNKIKEEFE